jgi:hypothetical protein
MPNRFWWAIFFLLGILFLDRVVFADMTVFDFNQAPTSPRRHANNYVAVESYMQGLFGSDISVSRGTTAVTGIGNLGNTDMTLTGGFGSSINSPDAFLLSGKGRNSGLVLSFDSSPINSFAVDWEVFKKGTGIIIKADGVVIYQNLLTKSESKTGIMNHLAPVYFNSPVHTLEFIGLGKTRIGIDNLAVNIPLPANGSENQSSDFPLTDSGGGGETRGDKADGLEGTGNHKENGNGDSGAHTELSSAGNNGDPYPRGWNGNEDSSGSYQPNHQVPEPATFILFGLGLLVIRVGRIVKHIRRRQSTML